MIPNWLTGFPYSLMHSLNLDWLLKKVASIDPSGFVRTINDVFRPNPETGNLNLTALNVGALPINDPAVDARKLGGKAPGYYLSPANLLDNSDFRNPVNQRGFESGKSLSNYAYFFDRWKLLQESVTTISYSKNGLTMNQANIAQFLDNIPDGKVYTGAIKLSDGTVVCASGLVSYNEDGSWKRCVTGSDDLPTASVFLDTLHHHLEFSLYTHQDATIEWAALYEGAFTAETLPPYVPKGYAAEFTECQKYYVRINCKNKPLGFGHAFTANAVRILVPTPVSMMMHKAPSITFETSDGVESDASGTMLIATNGTLLTPTAVNSDGVARENGVILLCTVSGATTYQPASLYCSGIISFSTDL